MELNINNLHIGYDFPLMKDLTLQLESGVVYMLLGNNGTGKTTFLKTLVGILKPLNGELNVPKNIGFVGTNRPEVEYLSVKEYWEFGIHDSDSVLQKNLCRELQLDDLQQTPIKQLSDGQYKKVSIIRQLLKKPSILLLDEPTAYLDIDNKKILGDFIQKNKQQYISIISTHDLDFAKKYGEQFLVLKDKKLSLFTNFESTTL